MSDNRTEREALLEARVKELEAEARASAMSAAHDGIFETIWRTINTIVPPWLAVAALAVFIGHYGFEYYMGAQIAAAETQLKNAKAAVEDAEASAQNQIVDGVPTRLATAKAQLAKTQAEASRAKAEATAKTAKVNDETLSLATAKAQLANTQAEASRAKAEADGKTAQVNGDTMSLATAKAQLESTRNQAALTKAKADAASANFGVQTLEQRLVRAKLISQQFQVIDQRVTAASTNSVNRNDSLERLYAEMVRAECQDNQFAALIGCPAQYVASVRTLDPSAPLTGATRLAGTEQQQADTASYPYYARVMNAPELTLRACPQSTCEDLGHLPQGLVLRVQENAGGGWFKVQVQKAVGGYQFGYVNGKFVNRI